MREYLKVDHTRTFITASGYLGHSRASVDYSKLLQHDDQTRIASEYSWRSIDWNRQSRQGVSSTRPIALTEVYKILGVFKVIEEAVLHTM